jgi:hypothetical protein
MHRNVTFTDQEPIGGAVAKQDAADGSLQFIPLGEAADAVIMKLSAKLPRIRVKRARLAPREENQSQPL